MPDISKSTRHSKIAGDYAEHLILYFLSKHGFECARVDHTGIDIIAKNRHTTEVMGVSVKGRSRCKGTEKTSLRIPADHFKKVDDACKAFGCVAYYSIVVDLGDETTVFLLSGKTLAEIYPRAALEQGVNWAMDANSVSKYRAHPDIVGMTISHRFDRWWNQDGALAGLGVGRVEMKEVDR
jgi:hypothetical protein